MARARARGGFIRPPARTMVWVGNRLGLTTVAASTSILLSSLNAAALALRPFTVVRTRLLISFDSDQLTTDELTQAVYTQQVVTESAASAGIGSVPTGVTEPDADYFVYQGLFQTFTFVTGSGLSQDGSNLTYEVDSKAMRKVGSDDNIVTCIEIPSATGSRIAIEGRMLIKLH